MTTSSSLNARAPAAGTLRHDARVIGLVGLAHLISHFSQLLLAPLFPWLKDAFNVSYAELGFLVTIFFVVSCAVQAMAGFVVDRFGPRPLLFGGLALLGIAAFGYSLSTSYWMMAGFAVMGGVGNGVFHPVDYTLLNRKISPSRLGHAYSVHGITGSLGWALAPALVVTLTLAYSWRVALASAAVLVFAVLAILLVNREKLALKLASPDQGAPSVDGGLNFLKIPAVWICFAFFFYYKLLADRTHLLLQLQGFAACGDAEVRDDVRSSFAAMWEAVAQATGLKPVTVKTFLAFGMLLNSGAALNIEDLEEEWAAGLRTRINSGLFAHITTEANQ